jgi:hypothetical protein
MQLDEDIQRAITTAIDESFIPMPIPTENDWLTSHYEPGQTVRQFERLKKPQACSTLVNIHSSFEINKRFHFEIGVTLFAFNHLEISMDQGKRSTSIDDNLIRKFI